jgi:ribose transport system permease protein
MLALKGINLVITDGKAITGFSDAFIFLGQGKLLGINIPIWCFVIFATILGILLNRHKFFRQVYFIGGNEKAAAVSGVNVKSVKIFFYVLCSILAGIAGILGAARFGAAHWVHGNGLELKAIAAVAIGGASLYGGSGTIGSTILGVIFLSIVHNAFVMSDINTFWYDVVNGGMLLLAVLFSCYVEIQKTKSMIQRRHEKVGISQSVH